MKRLTHRFAPCLSLSTLYLPGSRQAFYSLLFTLCLASCGPSSGGCRPEWAKPDGRLLGAQAHSFELPNLRGEKVALAPLVEQKPVLLAFWATWCPTCVEEIPVLNEWSQEYPELQILGINVQEPRERIQAFIEKKEVLYPVLLDENAEVAERYGLVGLPAAILLARGGKIIYYGFTLPRNIERLIQT